MLRFVLVSGMVLVQRMTLVLRDSALRCHRRLPTVISMVSRDSYSLRTRPATFGWRNSRHNARRFRIRSTYCRRSGRFSKDAGPRNEGRKGDRSCVEGSGRSFLKHEVSRLELKARGSTPTYGHKISTCSGEESSRPCSASCV